MPPGSGCARGTGRRSASPRSMPRRSRWVCPSLFADEINLRDGARGFERRVDRSAAGVAEAAGAARSGREFIDLDNLGANDRRDDQLGDSIARLDDDRLLSEIYK